MAYYFRVFCTSGTVPPLPAVLAWVADRGVSLKIAQQDLPPETGTADWGEMPVGLLYADDKPPFLAEVNRKEGENSLAAQEIDEFISQLESLKKSRKRDSVIEHLRKTQFIVVCQIPTDGFDDAGFHALDVFLAYFVVHHGGMVQADGQGFYEMGKLIVELEE